MSLPGLYKRAGFTLIEVVITAAILIIIAAGGTFFGLNQYKGSALTSEKSTLISVFHKARSRAINNIDQTNHGVSIQPGHFVIFEGSSYASRNTSMDENIPRSALISESGLQEIVFSQLSGELLLGAGDYTLSNGSVNSTINVNSEGRIN